jgi:hypothetical protein
MLKFSAKQKRHIIYKIEFFFLLNDNINEKINILEKLLIKVFKINELLFLSQTLHAFYVIDICC